MSINIVWMWLWYIYITARLWVLGEKNPKLWTFPRNVIPVHWHHLCFSCVLELPLLFIFLLYTRLYFLSCLHWARISLITRTQDNGPIFIWLKKKLLYMSLLLISFLPIIKTWFRAANTWQPWATLLSLFQNYHSGFLLRLVTGFLCRKSTLKKFQRRTTEGRLEKLLIWKWDKSYIEMRSPQRLEKLLSKFTWLERDKSRIWNPKHWRAFTRRVGGFQTLTTNILRWGPGQVLDSCAFYPLPQSQSNTNTQPCKNS